MIKTILVPTDFSKSSFHALEYALQFAQTMQAKLLIYHVYADAIEKNTAEQKLVDLREKLVAKQQNKPVEIELYSEYGEFIDCIAKISLKLSVDWIVIAMRGLGFLESILVGSNTLKMLSVAKNPVLVIPDEVSYDTIQHILFATDLKDEFDEKTILPMIELANLQKAEVRILTVRREQRHANVGESLERQRESHILGKQIKHSFKTVFSETVEGGIEFYMKHRTDHDLLAIINRKPEHITQFFAVSHAKTIVTQVKIPILVMSEV
jgi:nucleotide-binding universal stress UspA family protein